MSEYPFRASQHHGTPRPAGCHTWIAADYQRLHDQIEAELLDLRAIVEQVEKQIHLRYASYEISAGLDWRAEASRPSWAELQRRREPFTGVNPDG